MNLAPLRYAIGRVVKWLISRVVEGPYDSTTRLFNYSTKVEGIFRPARGGDRNSET